MFAIAKRMRVNHKGRKEHKAVSGTANDAKHAKIIREHRLIRGDAPQLAGSAAKQSGDPVIGCNYLQFAQAL